MTNIEIRNKLEERWGPMAEQGHYLENCPMTFVSTQARLNVLFNPEPDVEKSIREWFGSTMPAELIEFYKSYNGCRLFFGSLNVFGIQCHHEDVFEPYDLALENQRNYAKMKTAERKTCKLVFFASLGGDYVFGYDTENPGKIYCTKAGSAKVLKEFTDFDEFFTYYFSALLQEYDAEGRKIHPNKEFKGIPVLEHVTCKLF